MTTETYIIAVFTLIGLYIATSLWQRKQYKNIINELREDLYQEIANAAEAGLKAGVKHGEEIGDDKGYDETLAFCIAHNPMLKEFYMPVVKPVKKVVRKLKVRHK